MTRKLVFLLLFTCSWIVATAVVLIFFPFPHQVCKWCKGPFILHRSVLRCRTAHSYNITSLWCRIKVKFVYNLTCSYAVVTDGRDVVNISVPQRNCGVVWTDLKVGCEIKILPHNSGCMFCEYQEGWQVSQNDLW